jgi:hypothetical protein
MEKLMNAANRLQKEEIGRMDDRTAIDWRRVRAALVQHADSVKGNGNVDLPLPQRLDSLRRALSGVRDAHPESRAGVRHAIETIEAGLLPSNVRFAKAVQQDAAWSKPSILNLVISALEPVLATLLPIDGVSGWESWQASAILPLSNHLHDHTDCYPLVKAMRRMHADLDHALEQGFAESDAPLVSLAEGLTAIADALEQVAKAWPSAAPRWCACCFRRAPKSSRYCNLHRSRDITDTIYRKSLRTRQTFADVMEIRWTRHQAIRLVLNEPQQRLISHDHAWLPLEGPHAVVAEPVGMLALHSELQGDWAHVQPLWHAFIQQSCPEVAKRMGNLVNQAENWWDFCRQLHKTLDNRYEDTSSPLSILYLLVEAEEWFAAELACQDRRLTTNGERILSLLAEGNKPAAISRQLGLSRQYVSRYVKDYSSG